MLFVLSTVMLLVKRVPDTAACTHAAPAHEPNGSPTPCDMSTCDVNACACVVAECSGPAAGP